jgi:hypothetical protein
MSLKIQHLQFLDIKSDLACKYECDKFINKFNVIIPSQIFRSSSRPAPMIVLPEAP